MKSAAVTKVWVLTCVTPPRRRGAPGLNARWWPRILVDLSCLSAKLFLTVNSSTRCLSNRFTRSTARATSAHKTTREFRGLPGFVRKTEGPFDRCKTKPMLRQDLRHGAPNPPGQNPLAIERGAVLRHALRDLPYRTSPQAIAVRAEIALQSSIRQRTGAPTKIRCHLR